MSGWIKLHRKMMDWEWYTDPKTTHLFIHLILKANHKDKSWRGIHVERGQLITGRIALSEQTGISEKSIRTRLKRLQESNEISIKTASKFSIITICNYDDYQELNCEEGQQRASKGPAKGQQRATNKNVKNEKNDKKETKGRHAASVSSSENKGSSSSKEKEKPGIEKPTWISNDTWASLLSYRSEKRLKNSALGLNPLLKAFLKGVDAGYSADDCIGEYISAGWKRFDVGWMPELDDPNAVPGMNDKPKSMEPRNIREASTLQCDQIAKVLMEKRNAKRDCEKRTDDTGCDTTDVRLDPGIS